MTDPQSQSDLPIISLAPFTNAATNPEDLKKASKALYEACSTHGFFYLIDHGIAESELAKILRLAREFFQRASNTEKSRIKRRDVGNGNGDGARGYQELGENVTGEMRDWHEGIDWDREIEDDLDDGKESARDTGRKSVAEYKDSLLGDGLLRGKNPWPSEPADFRTVYAAFIQKVLDVGAMVVRAMGLALELTESEMEELRESTAESFWVMRAIGYPPLVKKGEMMTTVNESNGSIEDGTDGVSCGAHTDYGCLTLLLADPTPGSLQVQPSSKPANNEDSSEAWIPVSPIEGAFVVNIGDMFERWTNSEWKSTLHRVVHTSPSYRVSVPFFYEPSFNAVVRPFKTCVARTGGSPRWDPVVYGEHLVGKVRGNFYGGETEKIG